MSRPLYAEVINGIFHLTSRGNARRRIFFDDADYGRFLLCLKGTARRHEWRCLSYCLMPNHFHLLVQTPKPTRADGMRDLKSEYAQTFHRRYGTDGALFKPRYKPQLVQENGYLLAAAIYIAKNPVRAGLVEDPAQWRWSSLAAKDAFVDPTPILDVVSPDPVRALRDFRALALGEAPDFDSGVPVVGDADFIRQHAPSARPDRHVLKEAWEQARPPLVELAAGRDELDFVRCARHEHRYTLLEIARHLGCSARTVHRRLRVSGAGT